MTELSDQHTKTLLLHAYRQALLHTKLCKIGLVIAVILLDVKVVIDVWLWESFNIWGDGWFYLMTCVPLVFIAVGVFKFPHRFFSAPLKRRKVSIPKECDIKKLYDQCIQSLKLGFSLADPKTGKLTASNLP